MSYQFISCFLPSPALLFMSTKIRNFSCSHFKQRVKNLFLIYFDDKKKTNPTPYLNTARTQIFAARGEINLNMNWSDQWK